MNWYRRAQKNPFKEDIDNMNYLDIAHYTYRPKDIMEIGIWYIDDACEFEKSKMESKECNLNGDDIMHNNWPIFTQKTKNGEILAYGRYIVSIDNQKTIISCIFEKHKHYGDVSNHAKLSHEIASILRTIFKDPIIKVFS